MIPAQAAAPVGPGAVATVPAGATMAGVGRPEDSPFVGREPELRALQDALACAPDDAQGISEHLLAELAGDLEDDVAMLVLRVL